MADPNQCMGSWGVIAVRSGQNESDAANGLSTTSTVQVDGLDVCRFSYIVSGYIVTPGGVRGNTGTTNVFLPDLSSNAHCMPIRNDFSNCFILLLFRSTF